MSNSTVDALVQQYFPNNPPPALSNVAFLKGAAGAAQTGLPGGARSGIVFNIAKNYIQNLAQSGDIKGYYNDAANFLSTRYAVLAESRNDTSTVLNDIKELVKTAQNVGLNPADFANSIDTTINNHISDYNTRIANRDTGGGFLDTFGNVVGAIASPQGIAALGLAIATGGSSLALTVGEMAMGATAAEAAATVAGVAAGTATATAGAATVGAALVGSATSATLAAVSGGDVTKSAIAGAITGGAAANAGDIANAVTGGNVQTIASSTGLTVAQVSNIITNSVTTGVITAAVTGGDVGTAVASSLAAGGMSAEVQNTITENLPDMTSTAKLVGNVAGVATRAAVSGTDINTAIQNSIPNIIGGQLQDTTKTDTKKEVSQTDTGNTAVVVTTDPANNSALVMSTDGNVSVVSTTENIQSGSTVTVDPATNVATTTNAAVTGTTFQPTASGGTVVSDVASTTPLIKQKEGEVTLLGDYVYDPATDPRTVEQKLADYNAAIASGNTPEDAAKMANYTPPTNIATEINPTIIARDTVNPSANATRQIIDFISPTGNVANVTITAGAGNQAGANASIVADTGGTSNIGGLGTGNANVGIISTADNIGNVATSNVANVTITSGGANNANVTISDNVTNNAAITSNVAPTGNALTSILSPSIIPSKASGTASRGFGPSGAYLGQALGTTSPDSGLTGGPPVLSGEEGKKRNVWNVESLRNALGI